MHNFIRIFQYSRKNSMSSSATIDAFSDWIWPTLLRREITIGIEPRISMMAKSIIVTDRIWL
jgi:hypothetical protein